jgi:hypothetical protein|tara:strand:+ start:552 stop:908 length:357 start_codon:yes stop_codon:yes gene_type:complete
MKYNKLIEFCEEHNLRESDAINCVKKFIRKGSRPKWLADRFNLYAKERVRQLKLDCLCSKIDTVRKVVASDEYKQLHKKYNINTKSGCINTLNKLIAEQYSRERLLQAFKNNGEKEII